MTTFVPSSAFIQSEEARYFVKSTINNDAINKAITNTNAIVQEKKQVTSEPVVAKQAAPSPVQPKKEEQSKPIVVEEKRQQQPVAANNQQEEKQVRERQAAWLKEEQTRKEANEKKQVAAPVVKKSEAPVKQQPVPVANKEDDGDIKVEKIHLPAPKDDSVHQEKPQGVNMNLVGGILAAVAAAGAAFFMLKK
jgi:hypothetical protein